MRWLRLQITLAWPYRSFVNNVESSQFHTKRRKMFTRIMILRNRCYGRYKELSTFMGGREDVRRCQYEGTMHKVWSSWLPTRYMLRYICSQSLARCMLEAAPFSVLELRDISYIRICMLTPALAMQLKRAMRLVSLVLCPSEIWSFQ